MPTMHPTITYLGLVAPPDCCSILTCSLESEPEEDGIAYPESLQRVPGAKLGKVAVTVVLFLSGLFPGGLGKGAFSSSPAFSPSLAKGDAEIGRLYSQNPLHWTSLGKGMAAKEVGEEEEGNDSVCW